MCRCVGGWKGGADRQRGSITCHSAAKTEVTAVHKSPQWLLKKQGVNAGRSITAGSVSLNCNLFFFFFFSSCQDLKVVRTTDKQQKDSKIDEIIISADCV